MTKDEELFRKYCPDFCSGGECLEPYFSVFQAGMDVMQERLDQLQGYLDHDIEYDIEQRNKELVEENKRMKKQLRKAKDSFDSAADKTPVRACGAEYRLFRDIERMLEDWGAEDD